MLRCYVEYGAARCKVSARGASCKAEGEGSRFILLNHMGISITIHCPDGRRMSMQIFCWSGQVTLADLDLDRTTVHALDVLYLYD